MEEDRLWHCGRFVELKNVVHVATQIIDKNLFFRFFMIVHADKGFIIGGTFNTRLFNSCFVLFTVTFAIFTFLPITLNSLLKENYPANQIDGKVT